MRAAMTLNLTGHKDRYGSVRLTGSVVATSSASGQLFLTTDRHSYYRYREVKSLGLTIGQPIPDWPVVAQIPDLP